MPRIANTLEGLFNESWAKVSKMAKLNTKLTRFDGYCGKIARAFTTKTGLIVRFEGLRARTDGDTIYLPANSEEIIKRIEGRRTIDGILDHEWLHVFFNDEDRKAGRQTVLDYMSASDDQRYRMLLNIYDDIRIETQAPYEGVKQNLNQMNISTVEWLKTRPQTSEESFLNLGKAIILRARGKDVSYFHPGILSRLNTIESIVARAVLAKTSDDVHALAVETLKKLKEEEQQEQEQKSDQNGSERAGEPQEGEEGKGEGEGQGDDSKGQDEPSKGQGDDIEGESEKTQGKSKDKGKGKGKQGELDDSSANEKNEPNDDDMLGGQQGGNTGGETGEGSFVAPDQSEGSDGCQNNQDTELKFGDGEVLPDDFTKTDVEETLNRMARAVQTTDRQHLSDPRVLKRDSIWTLPEVSDIACRHFKNAIQATASSLKNKLVTVLLAKRTSFTQGDKDHGRLDNRSLHMVKTGNCKIFTQRVEGDSTNVAISLLVDCSYSMNGSRLRMAAQAAMVFGEALNVLGIPFNIWGFQTHDRQAVDYDLGSPYNRFSPYKFIHVKHFHERWARVVCRIPSLAIAADGCNDDGGALRFIARKLLDQSADRHILIVLSDGRPNAKVIDYEVMQNDLKRAICDITNAGVEVVGLGIQSKHVREYYPHFEVIRSLDMLPAGVIKQLRVTMIDKAKWNQRRGA